MAELDDFFSLSLDEGEGKGGTPAPPAAPSPPAPGEEFPQAGEESVPARLPSAPAAAPPLRPPPPAPPREAAPPSLPMEFPTPRGGARKASPSRRLPPALAPLAVAALLMAGGAWLAFTDGGRNALRVVLPRLAAYWSGRDGADRIEVGLRNLSMTTLPGGAAGDLFVIRGEVENLDGGVKSRLQVEAALVDGSGRERARRKVYAGNAPSDEELLKGTREEIERRLASPLGDRMANLDVQVGRSVPFTVVFAGVAPGEYTSKVKALDPE